MTEGLFKKRNLTEEKIDAGKHYVVELEPNTKISLETVVSY